MKSQAIYLSTVGVLVLVEEDGYLTNIHFGPDKIDSTIKQETTPTLLLAISELDEYFAGNRTMFTVPLALKGTNFQMKVWESLLTIPFGEVQSYKYVAQLVDNPKGSRAIGMANNKNPIPIIVPCHRVIGSNGKLVGYAGGLDIKTKLLAIENIIY